MPNRVHYQKAPARYKPGGNLTSHERVVVEHQFLLEIQLDFCMNLQPSKVWYCDICYVWKDMIYSTQIVPQVAGRFMWSCCIDLLLLLADWKENRGRTARCDDLRLSQLWSLKIMVEYQYSLTKQLRFRESSITGWSSKTNNNRTYGYNIGIPRRSSILLKNTRNVSC